MIIYTRCKLSHHTVKFQDVGAGFDDLGAHLIRLKCLHQDCPHYNKCTIYQAELLCSTVTEQPKGSNAVTVADTEENISNSYLAKFTPTPVVRRSGAESPERSGGELPVTPQ